MDYFNKTFSGANLLTISAGHTLDLVEAVFGEIVEVDARTEILWPTVKLTDTGGKSVRETADHVDILGKTRSGAVFTADISGGVAPGDARFSFEIRGSEGWLSLTSDHPYGSQAGDLKLTSNIPFATPDEPAVSGGFMGAAINVGEVYSHLVRDMNARTYSTRGFDHALHNARLIEAVRRAAADRKLRRGESNDWLVSFSKLGTNSIGLEHAVCAHCRVRNVITICPGNCCSDGYRDRLRPKNEIIDIHRHVCRGGLVTCCYAR
jgi:predicted dehydrogenase